MNANTLGDVVGRRTVDGYAPDLGHEPPEWTLSAVCASVDPEAFHADKGGSTKEAKSVCLGCPVRTECLIFAMTAEERADYHRYGVYGGLGPVEGRNLARAGWLPGDPTPDVVIGLPLVPCPHCSLPFKNVGRHVLIVHRDRGEAVA